jgi:hypothetical protein
VSSISERVLEPRTVRVSRVIQDSTVVLGTTSVLPFKSRLRVGNTAAEAMLVLPRKVRLMRVNKRRKCFMGGRKEKPIYH